MTNTDRVIAALAAEQHGAVSRAQLRDRGVGASAVATRTKRGGLVAVSRRVLRVAGTPQTDLHRAMAAVLDSGDDAVLSHRAAAWFWGVPGFLPDRLEVTAGRGRMKPGGRGLATIHLPRRLLAEHTTFAVGIPVTTPTRTVFDLAGLPDVHPLRVERVLDTLWARGRVDASSCTSMLDQLAGKGRSGIVLMRRLIEARGSEYRPPESNAEARFQMLASRAGLGGFERQRNIGGEERWIGRVDFVDRRDRIVVEVDPALHHGSLTDQRHDRERHAELRAAGWVVLSFTDIDLFHRSVEVVGRLTQARAHCAAASSGPQPNA